MERKEEKKNSPKFVNIHKIKNIIEKELNKICDEIQSVIDKYFLPNASDSETKVFFLKLKGDYYRYNVSLHLIKISMIHVTRQKKFIKKLMK